jgi:hypothetical protein
VHARLDDLREVIHAVGSRAVVLGPVLPSWPRLTSGYGTGVGPYSMAGLHTGALCWAVDNSEVIHVGFHSGRPVHLKEDVLGRFICRGTAAPKTGYKEMAGTPYRIVSEVCRVRIWLGPFRGTEGRPWVQ